MANQSLQNLKRIHELQKDGELTNTLKMIKNAKTQVDAFGNELSKRLKEISVLNIQKEETKPEVNVSENKEKEDTNFVVQKKPETTQYKKFEQKDNKIKRFDKFRSSITFRNNARKICSIFSKK